MEASPRERRRRWAVIGLIAVLVLTALLVIAWAMGRKMATDTDKIDTWAEGLGTLGTVGEGIDALIAFKTWFYSLFSSSTKA